MLRRPLAPTWRLRLPQLSLRATSSTAAAAPKHADEIEHVRPRGSVYRFSESHLPTDLPAPVKRELTSTPASKALKHVAQRERAKAQAETRAADASAEFDAARLERQARRKAKFRISERLPRAPPATTSIAPDLRLIPRLAHGLEHVLRSPGVHLLRDPVSQKFNFDPYLATIQQPEDLDLSALPTFVPSSRDAQLWQLADELKCGFISSTSSISGIFAVLVHTVTRFRSLKLSSLSGPFSELTHQSTKVTTQAIAFSVRPNARGTYAVDSGAFDVDTMPDNLVLIDLGKSLESMLTLDKQSFENLLVKSPAQKAAAAAAAAAAATATSTAAAAKNEAPQNETPADAHTFHYMKVGDMLLRAQLDCADESLPGDSKTFDIKTRATIAVRRDCRNYHRHVGYRLSRLLGEYHSFEREFYDMARSAFLKYNMQVRIGRMNGVFVAFHNTRELFGFEYLSRLDLDECLFGSSALGDRVFDVVCQLTERMLQGIVADNEKALGKRSALRCVMVPDRNNSVVHLFVERVEDDPGWRDQQWRHAAPKHRHTQEKDRREAERRAYEDLCKAIKGPISHYTLAIDVIVNGKHEDEPFEFKQGDVLDIDYGWALAGVFTEKTVPRLFWDALRQCK
jgi:hypothetical protein